MRYSIGQIQAAGGAGDASPPAQQLLRTVAASAAIQPQQRNAEAQDGFPLVGQIAKYPNENNIL
jgi:hypothetical protein